MKTKSLLFAALVSVTFATTSCQKEAAIMPAGIDQYSMGTLSRESRKLITDDVEIVNNNQTSTPKTEAKKDSTLVMVGQIQTNHIK